MKRLFSMILTFALLTTLLCGCVCETADTTIAQDGSGKISVRFGFSEAVAERLDLYEELDEEGFDEFTYQGKTYLGDTAEQSFATVSEFNEVFAALNQKATAVSEAGSLGKLTLSKSGADFTLTLVCSDKSGNKSAMSAALKEMLPELSDSEASALLTDTVMTYSFAFPTSVRQTSGGSNGVSVSGSTVKIDLLFCTAGTYVFTTAKEGTACDKGTSCPLDKFTDLKNGEWYHDGIHYCLANGMMNGASAATFAPQSPASRGAVFTILARMDGVTITSTGNNWFMDGAAWVKKAGVSDGSAPTDNVTRAQLALMLYRFAEYMGYHTDARADLSGFSDAASIETWMKEPLQWAVGSGIMGGDDRNMVNPQKGASRAEVATMLYRFCIKAAK